MLSLAQDVPWAKWRGEQMKKIGGGSRGTNNIGGTMKNKK